MKTYTIDYTIAFLSHGKQVMEFTSSETEIPELTEISGLTFDKSEAILNAMANAKSQIELEMRELLDVMNESVPGIHSEPDEIKVCVHVYEQCDTDKEPVDTDVTVEFEVNNEQ